MKPLGAGYRWSREQIRKRSGMALSRGQKVQGSSILRSNTLTPELDRVPTQGSAVVIRSLDAGHLHWYVFRRYVAP